MGQEIEPDVLIVDIETKTEGKPNPDKDILRVFGCYSYRTHKAYILTNTEDMHKIIHAHKFIVGFNIKKYDVPVMKRAGLDFEYKILIDLFEIFKERAVAMKVAKGMLGDLLMSYSLDFISRTVGVVDDDTAKLDDFDYQLLNKPHWTQEDITKIKKYTLRDIEITKKLYEWTEEYFLPFKDFLREDDIRKKKYLTVTIAKFAYKAICKAMKWEEQYGEVTGPSGIAGGYVAFPAGEKFEGNVYCLDFASLYPHVMVQYNLYGRDKENDTKRKIWDTTLWKTEGKYYSDAMSGVCELLHRWYKERVVFKKAGDRREYSIKIILNAIYGILNNSYYTRVYDIVAGGDCTRLGRQWVKFARKRFKESGYTVIYTDTDSVYLIDNFNDEEKLIKIKDDIISTIKSGVPFPVDTFDMNIEAKISCIFFFKGGVEDKDTDVEMDEDDFINKSKGLMKKNYIYLTTDGKLVLKNLGVKKKSISALTKKIFWEFLVPSIKEKHEVQFNKTYLQNLILELLQKDVSLAAMRKNVGVSGDYANTSPTGLPAQITQRYGAGIHFLIPNTRGIGVGKGKSYCTIEEFRQHKLRLEDIDLSNIWKELEYFTKPVVMKNIFDFGAANAN